MALGFMVWQLAQLPLFASINRLMPLVSVGVSWALPATNWSYRDEKDWNLLVVSNAAMASATR